MYNIIVVVVVIIIISLVSLCFNFQDKEPFYETKWDQHRIIYFPNYDIHLKITTIIISENNINYHFVLMYFFFKYY